MHFRVRKNVVQFVRTTYDAARKKPRAEVVGRMPLRETAIPPDLKALLSADEVQQAEAWIGAEQRVASLREELAARELADTLAAANRWFRRKENHAAAASLSGSILPALQALRKSLSKSLD